jgi:hypothetical protein
MPRIACAVYAGIIREVYVAQKWECPEGTSGKIRNRKMFTGVIASPEVRDKYLNKSVAHLWKHGSQNPIKYVGNR